MEGGKELPRAALSSQNMAETWEEEGLPGAAGSCQNMAERWRGDGQEPLQTPLG